MLSASSRNFIRSAPSSREMWRRLLVVPEPVHSYSTASQKPPRTIKTQKTIVRTVNGRKAAVNVRPSSSQVPPPAAPPAAVPAPPPPPAAAPPPAASAPPPGGDGSRWGYVAAAVAAAGIGGAVYYYTSEGGGERGEQAPKTPQEKLAAVARVPASIADIPAAVEYLLIGGGTASFAAFRAIKSNQPKAQVLVISEEDALPYMRPPLSKELWRNTELSPLDQLTFQQWNGNRRSIYYEMGAFYADVAQLPTLENGGVGVARGYRVTRLEPAAHRATIAAPGQPDRDITYRKCLIATGVRPRNISVLERAPREVRERCVLLRTVRDAARLWRRLESARDVLVVGSGFLGSEIACALSAPERQPLRVTQVFRESGPLAHVLPEHLAAWTARRLRRRGVRVLPRAEIERAYMKGERVVLDLSNGDQLEADVIVVGAGSEPNVELARDSGLEIDPQFGGLTVNAELQARTDLYVAGDVASFYDPVLGRRRVEHHDHAVVSGRLAGENMAAAAPARHYAHQSMFWSDLGADTGLEAIGLVDSSLPTVSVFAEQRAEEPAQAAASSSATTEPAGRESGAGPAGEPAPEPEDAKYEKGVVFYLRGKKVVGVVMWNLFNRMAVARQLLAQQQEYEDLNEVAKLFRLHE